MKLGTTPRKGGKEQGKGTEKVYRVADPTQKPVWRPQN